MTIEAASSTEGNAPASVLATPPPAPPAPPAEPAKNEYPAGDWRATLPDDLRSEPSLKVIHDIPAMAKSFIHAQRMVGADKVPLPSKHATDEDWQSFYDKVGRPPVDKYEVKIKDAKFVDENTLKELTPIAHKAGIMPSQLEKVLSWYEGRLSLQQQAALDAGKKQVEEGITGLKKEWGKAYDKQISYATTLLKEKGDPELIKWLDESGMGNNPHLIRAFAKLGQEMYGEDKLVDGAVSDSIYTPDVARQKANEIMANKEHPYNIPEHPNHRAAVQEVQGLFSMIYVNEAKT